MRDTVLIGASLEEGFANLKDALQALEDVVTGLLELSTRNFISDNLWTDTPTYEIAACPGFSLNELFFELNKLDPDKSWLLLEMMQICPIEDFVSEDDLGEYLEWEIENLPRNADLLLCAISDSKIAACLTPNEEWRKNPLELRVGLPGNFQDVKVDNVFSQDSAMEIIERIRNSVLERVSPKDFWNRRNELFPDLLFGLDVKAQIERIGNDIFKSALSRFHDLNAASVSWSKSKSPNPSYPVKVRGESQATMNKHGNERMFRSSADNVEIFEKHANLRDGHRLHLREVRDQRRIEIGYIGPHLRIVSEN